MKKIYSVIALFALLFNAFGQTSTQTLNTINVPVNVATPDVLVGVFPPTDPSTPNRWRFYNFSALRLPATQVTGLDTAISTLGYIKGSSIKKVETFSGTTNASGVYSVTFPAAYSLAPNIQANIVNGTDTQTIRITSVTTTGCSVLVRNRVDVIGLLPTYANVNGASVDILITAKWNKLLIFS